MYTDKSFERAYLQSLHIIKEDVDATESQSQQEVKPEEAKTPSKCICFCTTDPNLIDVINSGFEKVIFSVKTADEEETTDVEFGPEAFGEIEVKEQEETEECPECGKTPCECDDETCQECGKSPCECEKDEDLDLNEDVEEDTVEECGDNQITEEDEEFDEEDLVEERGNSLTEEDIIKECNKLRRKF